MGQRLSEESDPDKEIDVAELQEWYKKFVVECPSGTLFMHEFKGFFGVTENKEAADYIENMFRAFDKNGVSTNCCVITIFYNQRTAFRIVEETLCLLSKLKYCLHLPLIHYFPHTQDNTIDFLEYVAALNLVLRGKLEHKLKWTFKMYDKDGSGCIDKTELLEIVEVKSTKFQVWNHLKDRF